MKDLIPGLTDFRIKEARKHCKEHGPGTSVPTAPVHRFFLSEDKVDHFLRFITSDMISRDTAYGTSRLKLESGVELVIPKPIRKSLQGLDNYTADGSEAFENLEEIISKLYDGGMPDSKADRLCSMALPKAGPQHTS